MIIGIGTDLINIQRIERLIKAYPKRFIQRIFTLREQFQAPHSHPYAYYAKRFAAKEAFLKALGTGYADQVSWQNICIEKTASGKPVLTCSGQAFIILQRKTKERTFQIDLSLSDEYPYAQAFVVISV